jgi:3-methyladenine DNA glycosylase AlkD
MDADTVAAEIVAEVAALPPPRTAAARNVRRRWTRRLKAAPREDILALARALGRRRRRWIGHELIRGHRGAFEGLTAAEIEEFAEGLDSWDTVDAYGCILAGPAWLRGRIDDARVLAWTASPDRWRRRLALVATVGLNARKEGGPGDVERTLAVCERLVADRDDMVVKAMSWALRALAVRHPQAVRDYLARRGEVLAARVKREVGHKLTTGLKTPKRPA